jgi:anion-transporting  ArsA/GET3 family ATPase
MSVEEKKTFLLLLVIIFNYHGLSDVEQQILKETATAIDAQEELEWVKAFSKPSIDETYDKIKQYINHNIKDSSDEKKLISLTQVWDANMQKGYISEMEATAMLMLSKEWKIQKEFILHIREKKKTS